MVLISVINFFDISGLSCPLQVLTSRQAINNLGKDDILTIIPTDQVSKEEIVVCSTITTQEPIENYEEDSKFVLS